MLEESSLKDYNPKLAATEDDEVSIKEVLLTINRWIAYLLTQWKWIFLFGLLGGLLGFAYAFFKKPTYSASSTFVLEESASGSSGLGQYSGLASMMGLDMGSGGGIFQGDNLLELYKSRKMITKTFLTEVDSSGKKRLLIDIYIEINGLRNKWKSKPELKNVSFKSNQGMSLTRIQDSLIGVFVQDINKSYLAVTKPDKKLNIIKVQITSANEFFAKKFNDVIVNNVNEFYLLTKTKKSLNNLQILQHQTDSIRTQLNGAITSVASVLDANPNLNPSRLQLRTPSQRRGVDVEVNKAILTQLITNMELAKVTLRKEAPLIQLIDSPVFPLEKEYLGKLKAMVIGAIVFGFIATFILLCRYIIKGIFNS
ncbi:hypothetical protein HDE69_003411 [Pedobacter cryoconitis]|uniref:Polysaccharide chain length determinant N-terminal domain-containing protein n=1 Tax=Pedobacter cryoconitis TaxID=188932 RepID=A0A7W8YV13_9SPHI|nr:Wzz/FepE/Etk N-terminal domain-containing protein [Pedobacter cryoconitis]MBB5622336.1 hypothetical protein [Pedobacter cryoconitis]